MTKKLAILLIFAVLVIFADDGLYRLDIAGNEAGFLKYSLVENETGFEANSRIFMRISYMGKNATTSFKAKTVLNKQYQPIDYDLDVTINGQQKLMKCKFAADTVGISFILDGKATNTSMMLDADTYIIDSSVFDHFFILTKAMDLNETKSQEFAIYLPQIFQKTYMTAFVGSELEYRGKDCKRVSYRFLGNEAEAIVNPIDNEVLEYSISAEDLKLTKVDELDTLKLKNTDFADVYSRTVNYAPSNIKFDRPYDVKEMEIEVKVPVKLIKNSTKDAELYLENSIQDFKGEIDGKKINGIFKIKSREYDGKKSFDFPYTEFLDDLSIYFLATNEYPSGDSMIAAKAIELAESAENSWEAARAIVRFTCDSMKFMNEESSVKNAFIKREGTVLSQVKIAITMLRTLGIPARLTGGIIYSNQHFTEHYWAEVYVEKNKWVPIDPATGESDFFSSVHVSLWEGFAKIDLQGEFKVEVKDYELREIKK